MVFQALSLIQSGCDPRCDCPRALSRLALSGAAYKYGHNEPSTGRQRSVSRWIGLVCGIGDRGEVIGSGDGGRTQPMSTQAVIVGSTPMTGRWLPIRRHLHHTTSHAISSCQNSHTYLIVLVKSSAARRCRRSSHPSPATKDGVKGLRSPNRGVAPRAATYGRVGITFVHL